ncbi:MAG: aminoglycoside phosphotransferase family protein [Gemmatimonadetes bacterium]|nr:aminoglycoside phosphotransferase family protein [Gemmatimonadota bacterium]
MTHSKLFKDDSALAECIRRTFGLDSSAFPLHKIGAGFKSIVLGSPAGLVFRVARNEKAKTGHRRECHVLSKLKSLLPVEVPEVLGYCEVSDDFPFGVMMQQKIEGPSLGSVLKRSQRVKPIADLMGELVLAIQKISQDDLPELPSSSAPQPEETWSYAYSFLKATLTPRELCKAQDWWEQYCENWELGCPVQRFSHGDLWHEHILFNATDEPRVAGVLDWEYAGFGDPIFDFIPQMSLGREYVTYMLEAYQAKGGEFGPDALPRIELYLPYRELGGLCYCLETGDMREAQFCVEKFRTVLGPS